MQKQANQLLDSLPLRFEANHGQLHQDVRFYSRFAEQPVFLTGREALLSLSGRVLRVRPRGARANLAVRGVDLLPARSSYFLRNLSSQWRTGVEQFAAVRYEQIYPGIDLVYKGNGKRLEYDFVVEPGGDPRRIRMEFAGADRISVDDKGALIIRVGSTVLRQPRPFVYQETSANERTPIDGSYRIVGRNQIAFTLAPYDPQKTLVIDPIIVQGTYLGGLDNDVVTAVAMEPSGRLWITGYTTSPDFPALGAFRDASAGRKDIFVAAFNPSRPGAESLVYSTYIGGSEEDEPRGIAVDGAGSAFLTGFTSSTDFPVRNGYQDTNGGSRDIFVCQVNLTELGDPTLWYSTYFGGAQIDVGNAVAVDARGRVYITGYTSSEAFPLLGDSLQRSIRGGWDVAFVVLEPTRGGRETGRYSTLLGGESTDVGTGIAVNAEGTAIFMGGYSMSPDFPSTLGAFQPVYKGRGDAFVARIDLSRPALDALIYATLLGGSDLDQASAMTIDPQGRVYLAGTTFSTDLPLSPNAYQTRNAGESDIFAARFDFTRPPGQELTYSSYLGGSRTDVGYGLAVDRVGRIQLAGYTFSADFPVKGEGLQNASGGGFDGFVAWLDPAAAGAESLACSSYLGGEGNEVAYGIVSDSAGTSFAVGTTNSRRLGLPEGALQAAPAGFLDGFLVRLGACPERR
jgi:hypothetical protein